MSANVVLASGMISQHANLKDTSLATGNSNLGQSHEMETEAFPFCLSLEIKSDELQSQPSRSGFRLQGQAHKVVCKIGITEFQTSFLSQSENQKE
jgi:hypothetical protein